MPYYEYHCAANGRTVEVRHGMHESIETWGDLLERSGLSDDGGTPARERVERLMSAPVPPAGTAETVPAAGCGSGCACAAARA